MATIRPRGNQWQCIVKRKGYPNQSHVFDSKRDAERRGRQQEYLMDSSLWIDRSESEGTTLAELLDRYCSEVSSLKRGYSIERSRIGTLKSHSLAKHSVAAIDSRLITAWRDSRLQSVSAGTVAREMQLLSHVLSIALKEWGFAIYSNPVANVRKPSAPPARNRVLNSA